MLYEESSQVYNTVMKVVFITATTLETTDSSGTVGACRIINTVVPYSYLAIASHISDIPRNEFGNYH